MKTCTFLLLLALPLAAQYREEIEVRVIDVDVVVTDKQGRPITDLTRDDFELLEDGRPVEIRYFSRVVGGQLLDLPPMPPVVSDAGTPAAAPATPGIPLTWVVFLDQTSIPMRYRTATLEQLWAFLDRAVAAGDRAIVANNDGMVFRIQQGLTSDKGKLLETVKKLQKAPVYYGAMHHESNRIKNEIVHQNSEDNEFEWFGEEISREINLIIEDEVKRTRHAILAMNTLVDLLGNVEGRMALVYAGAGFNTLPGLALTEMWRARWPMLLRLLGVPRPEDHQPKIEQDVLKLYQNLSTSRVAVYTVYAGENNSLPAGEEMGNFLEGGRSGERAVFTEAAMAREMSDRTGGLFFKTNARLADQLEAMRRDLNNYYSLGYVPKGEPGKQHRVHIKLKREGARPRYRESVRELSAEEEARRAAMLGAMAPPPPAIARVKRTIVPASQAPAPPIETSEANPLGVAVTAARPRQADVGRDRLMPFELTMNLEALTFREVAGVIRADFLVHFVVTGPDGMWPVDTREHSLTIPGNEAPKEGQHVSYSWNVDLAPLRLPPQIPIKREGMKLVVTVEDRASGRQSIVKIPMPR